MSGGKKCQEVKNEKQFKNDYSNYYFSNIYY